MATKKTDAEKIADEHDISTLYEKRASAVAISRAYESAAPGNRLIGWKATAARFDVKDIDKAIDLHVKGHNGVYG